MNDYSRLGIYIGSDGRLTTSVCHARPENAGRGECRHFSFAKDSKALQDKLTCYLTDRITGTLSENAIDGTAGDYLSALRNWLVLENGYDRDALPNPDGSTILTAWFHDDKRKYNKIINEAMETPLFAAMRIGAEQKESIKGMADAGMHINVISSPTLDDISEDRIAADTAALLSMNGISDDTDVHESTMDESTIGIISSGDAHIDVHELERLANDYVHKGESHDDDIHALDHRYDDLMDQSV